MRVPHWSTGHEEGGEGLDTGQALSDGRRLARETLLALLRDGGAPDWTRLVMSASDDEQGQSALLADSEGERA